MYYWCAGKINQNCVRATNKRNILNSYKPIFGMAGLKNVEHYGKYDSMMTAN